MSHAVGATIFLDPEEVAHVKSWLATQVPPSGQGDNWASCLIAHIEECQEERLAELVVKNEIKRLRDQFQRARNIIIDVQNFIGPATVWRDEALMRSIIEKFIEDTRPDEQSTKT